MAQNRYYASTAQPTILVNTISPTTTSIQLQQVIGFPSNTPFTIALDYNTSGEELALVTNVAGTTLTITRGFDGTSASGHNVGAGVRHVSAAIDFNEAGAHIGNSSSVHGITGSVVGTTDTQVLTNKTLSGGSITGTISGSPTWTSLQTFGNGATFPTTIPTFPVGLEAGSTNQLAIDSSGNVTSSGSTNFTNGIYTGNLSVTGRLNSGSSAVYTESSTPGTANTSSTTYVDVGTTVSVTIVVPPSGKVYVSGRAAAFNGTGGTSVWSVVNVVGSVSGTLRASVDAKGLEVRITSNMAGTDLPVHESFVQTATPGETLTIKWQHRTTGGTAGIDYRSLSAIPMIG